MVSSLFYYPPFNPDNPYQCGETKPTPWGKSKLFVPKMSNDDASKCPIDLGFAVP